MIPVRRIRRISGDGINGVADAIYNAAIYRFFYISNHGIDPVLMERRLQSQIFELPEVDKQAIAVDEINGWLAQGMSRMQGSKTHDLKEVFFWGPHTEVDDMDVGL